ncbi:MAG: hypothetical protein ACFFC7_15345 [Candidatus Hermodarchaeota archaeon]
MSVVTDVVNLFKKGYELWKQAWLTEIVAMLVLTVISVIVLMPLAILIAIAGVGTTGGGTWSDWITWPGWANLLGAFTTNPLLWLMVLLLIFVLAILATVFVGAIQKVAHTYAETGSGRFEDVLKSLLPNIVPLAIVGIVMALIIGIPLIIVGLIFGPISNPETIDVFDILQTLVYTIVIIVLMAPWFLATSAVVIDEAGPSSIVEGWKFYFRKLVPTLIIVIILVIIAIIVGIILGALGLLMPLFAADPANLSPVFLILGYVALILGLIVVFAVIPWLITTMYLFYQEHKASK